MERGLGMKRHARRVGVGARNGAARWRAPGRQGGRVVGLGHGDPEHLEHLHSARSEPRGLPARELDERLSAAHLWGRHGAVVSTCMQGGVREVWLSAAHLLDPDLRLRLRAEAGEARGREAARRGVVGLQHLDEWRNHVLLHHLARAVELLALR